MKHRVVVIGAGYFGQRHIKVLSEMRDVEIVGVVDRDIEKAKDVAKSLGADFSESFDKFISTAQTFFIVTPTKTHYEIAKELIERGKNLFIEKPMVETPEQATELFEEAYRRGVIIQVGLIERFNPAFSTLLDYTDSPMLIQANRASTFQGRALDTDVTFDLMIHDLDLVWSILRRRGEFRVKKMRTFTKKLIGDRIDFATVWLDIESSLGDLKVNLTANRISSDFQRTFTVVDRDQIIYADLLKRRIFKTKRDALLQEIPVEDRDSQPLHLEIRDFLESVQRRVPSKIAPSPEEVVEVLKIIREINGGD